MIIVELRLVLKEDQLPDGYQSYEQAREYVARTIYEEWEPVAGSVPLVSAASGQHLVAEMSEHQVQEENEQAVLEALRTGNFFGSKRS